MWKRLHQDRGLLLRLFVCIFLTERIGKIVHQRLSQIGAG
jgi:hypothetical protein